MQSQQLLHFITSMAEAIAILSLAGQLFTGCVQAYHLLATAYKRGSVSKKYLLELVIEQVRLLLWGRNSGVSDGFLKPSLHCIASLITGILQKMKATLQDSAKLRTQYGLDYSKISPNSEKEDLKEAEPAVGGDGTAEMALQSPLFGKQRRHHIGQNLSKSLEPVENAFKSLRWAVADKSKFEILVGDLRQFNDSLISLLQESQRAESNNDFRQWEMELVGSENAELLTEIQNASAHSYPHLYALAGQKALGLRLEIEPKVFELQRTTKGSPNVDEPLWKNIEMQNIHLDLSLPQEAGSRLVTRLDGEQVFIERRLYESGADSITRQRISERLAELAARLHKQPQPSGLCALHCRGFFTDRKSFSFVFDPPVTSTDTTRGGDSLAMKFVSLSDRLASGAPPLETRLALASKLVACFSEFQATGWLHRNVRSQNIIFFHETSLLHPFVGGFEYSRQGGLIRSLGVAPPSIYQHPEYHGEPTNKYCFYYDVYSLGLVLFEIAHWRSLDYFVSRRWGNLNSCDLRKKVLSEVDTDLVFRVGTKYCDILRMCVGYKYDFNRLSDEKLKLLFFRYIVKPLERLTASLDGIEMMEDKPS